MSGLSITSSSGSFGSAWTVAFARIAGGVTRPVGALGAIGAPVARAVLGALVAGSGGWEIGSLEISSDSKARSSADKGSSGIDGHTAPGVGPIFHILCRV